jgi:hypothetical protein
MFSDRPTGHHNVGVVLEPLYSNLHFACNQLILLGSNCFVFTANQLIYLPKNETLNQRVPGSSPGAPTIAIE